MTGSTPELSSRLMEARSCDARPLDCGPQNGPQDVLAHWFRRIPDGVLSPPLAIHIQEKGAGLLLINCSKINTGQRGVPFDQALGAKARLLPSPLLVLVTRSFSSRYRWPLKCSLTVRSPTVSWRHSWDPLRPKLRAKRNQIAQYRQSAS